MKLTPLVHEEIIGNNRFNYYIEVKAGIPELAVTVAAQAATINFSTAYKYNRINNVALIVQEAFENTADAAYNSLLVDVGDASDADGWIAAAQVNKNAGALIKAAYKTGALVAPKDYAADSVLSMTITPMAAKTLASLNRGSFIVLFDLYKFPTPIDVDAAAKS